jgi:hypothetical protein
MWEAARFAGERRLSIDLNLYDLIADEFVVTDHALDVASQKWSKRTSVSCPDPIEALY